jgi:hypothetical protein
MAVGVWQLSQSGLGLACTRRQGHALVLSRLAFLRSWAIRGIAACKAREARCV